MFDVDFKSLWKKKYNSEMYSQIEVNFKEPNIIVKNKLNYFDSLDLAGSISMSFLNKNIEIDYKFKNNFICNFMKL